ncbi:MAG: 4Fe-4S dicluster domain-containing protein [Clostridia bacterium]
MPHVITNRCVGTKDQSCVEVCPVDCIHPAKNIDGDAAFEEAPQLYIDPDVCIDCGACVPECPVDAIFMDDELPEEFREFLEVNANFYKPQG